MLVNNSCENPLKVLLDRLKLQYKSYSNSYVEHAHNIIYSCESIKQDVQICHIQ